MMKDYSITFFLLTLVAAMALSITGCSSETTNGDPDVYDVIDTVDIVDGIDTVDVIDTFDPAGEDPPPVDTVEDNPPSDLPAEVADVVEEETVGTFPIDLLDNVRLYINIGDSLAAGYNSSGRNGSGGHGYARLMLDNHADYPAYAGAYLRYVYSVPGVEFKDVSDSGDTSGEALSHLRGTSLPNVDGDVVVSLTCGGNDFNDDIQTILMRARTEAAVATLRENYIEMVNILRDRYEKPELGHHVVILMTNIHDPTAGTGAIPPRFTDGFCETIQNPMFIPLRATAIGNLNYFNEQMALIAVELGLYLVDNHGVFFDHGMNAPDDQRWLDTDCVHPINEGHHQLRREEWFVLTGERY